MSRHTFDKRVGRRVQVDPQPVLWRVDPSKSAPARRRRFRAPPTAELLDVSVSGLRVRGPAPRDLRVGTVLAIEVDGLVGRVRIRRMDPEDGGRQCEYGLELVDAQSPLTLHLHRQLSKMSDVSASQWHGSRG
ncbi:PilZ domain-containing protein [Iamia sp.]|uniref:PilZ domain-containing protein n=1 Tax=Iamia sp. TaxID=2722710 RepID=UPI002BD1DD07|nr:PilZ domain-containing protein [Iamia sp.]HXH57070.1 PilZ domain-containing protein [Iamia sp.]